MNNIKRAFSLIEVLIVLAILALIASLILPKVNNEQNIAKYKLSTINLKEVSKAMEKHYLEKGVYPVFDNWDQIAAEESPLREYLNDIPEGDMFNRKFIVKSSEKEYSFEGLGLDGKLKAEYPDYTVSTGTKFKQKGKK